MGRPNTDREPLEPRPSSDRTTVVVRPHYAASTPQKRCERITSQPFTPPQLFQCAATELHFHYEELHFYYESCNFAFGSGIIWQLQNQPKSCARHESRDLQMTFSESIKTVYGQYATFSGRATRSEYWWFVLFVFIVNFLCGALIEYSLEIEGYSAVIPWSVVYVIFILVNILPSLALQVRRLHDTGNSGWWILIGLAPYIGTLVLLIFSLIESKGDNEYGPNPFSEEDE